MAKCDRTNCARRPRRAGFLIPAPPSLSHPTLRIPRRLVITHALDLAQSADA
jgi:hypothetical protein